MMAPLYDRLLALLDEDYRKMQCRLIPNLKPETILGVRTPELRKLANTIQSPDRYLQSLPHTCFEENQIHAFLLENEKDFSAVLEKVEAFLPYVDNWATCDQLRPKAFARYPEKLLPSIEQWLNSDEPYTVRFAMEMLMCHYLGQNFRPEYPAWVAAVNMDHYYVKMMAAWYFATALAKQYDAVLPYIVNRKLDPWVHKKAIQKAVESHRITRDQKMYLKKFR